MMKGQLIPAFIAALMVEGVEAEQIEKAVARVQSVKLGQSITGHPLRRAFAFEQARLLEKAAEHKPPPPPPPLETESR